MSSSRFFRACNTESVHEGFIERVGWMGVGVIPSCSADLIIAAFEYQHLLMGPKDRESVALHYLEMHYPVPLRLKKAVDVCSGFAAVCCQLADAAIANLLQRQRKSSWFFYLLVRDTVTAVCARTL